jgi:hypothetical protein
LGHGEVGHSLSKLLHGGGWAVDGDRWGGHCPVVVATGGWVVEQAGAQVKLAGMEVGLDGGRSRSMIGRCSWRMRMPVRSLLRGVLRGGFAWGRSPGRW